MVCCTSSPAATTAPSGRTTTSTVPGLGNPSAAACARRLDDIHRNEQPMTIRQSRQLRPPGRSRRSWFAISALVPAMAALVVTSGVRSAAADASQDAFIASAVQAAQNTQGQYQVPASVTIGQAILESQWGQSSLASNDNNYFGIKCVDADSPGPIATGCHAYPTTECTPTCHPVTAYFRVYRSTEDSFADHGDLLRNSGIYDTAFAYTDDPDNFVREIARDGYATDP